MRASTSLPTLRRARFMDLVVLLDNCEHVLNAVCEVLDAVLGTEPTTMRLVATSRERLRMPDECAWPLQPLDCSRPDSPAQQFFLRRADAARPGAVTVADPDAITATVRQLDGLPLAIELAAAQVATLGIADLGEQIEASVATPTPLGRLSRRGGEPRHRTLRAAIEIVPTSVTRKRQGNVGTVDRLRRCCPLGRRAGGAASRAPGDRRTRRALVAQRRDTLGQNVLPDAADGAFGCRPGIGGHRAQAYGALLGRGARAAAALQTAEEAAAHQRLVEIVDELRLAHSTARRIDIEAAVRMSMSLHWFGVSRLHTELLGWAAKLAPLVQDRPDLRAAVDSSIAYRYVIAEQLDLARQRTRSALADVADDQTRCRALEALGDSCIFQGDLDQAHSWWSELVKVGRRSGETYTN